MLISISFTGILQGEYTVDEIPAMIENVENMRTE